tara:strand:+ start:2822 stop:4324 length:1503 start_codon:yes stop_codon:yes gene_type:complete
MNKHINLLKFFKKIGFLIDSLIIKNSKKLKLNEKKSKILQFISAKRVFAAFIILLFLGFCYLSVPFFYKKTKIQVEIKNQLLKKYDINFKFSTDMRYNLFPWPNYKFENVQIYNENKKIADVKKLKINLNLSNFYSIKRLKIEDIFLENAKFDIHKKDLNFFFNILENEFVHSEIKIVDSFIFFKDKQDDVLFMNKIKEMIYSYDKQKLQNTLAVKNEIFKIPYNLEFYNDKEKKKIFSKVNINLFNTVFESEYSYDEIIKKGFINVNSNKNKSQVVYTLAKDNFKFKYFDKIKNSNFNYNGIINLKPFYLDFSGGLNKIDSKYLFDPNSLILQFLKTEILNNKNLNIQSSIKAKKITPYQKLINLLLNIKIQEGLIDIDESKFKWSNYAEFKIFDSLIYLNDNNLALDGKMKININNYDEIYKFFQTPRNYRKEVSDIEFVFNYNFDQGLLNISEIKIDEVKNPEVGNILNKLVSQENMLQNRIYLKNLINLAIKAYAG